MIQLLAWEEKNYTEQMQNSDNKKVSETKDTMTETKTSLMQNDWRDIIDPKLRKKMRDRANRKIYRNKHKEKIKEYQEGYLKEYLKEYQIKNRERLNAYRREYYKERQKKMSDKDVQFVISHILRNRFRQAIKKNHKTGHAVRDLGCSIIEFKSYLESKFQEGMSWNNYGLHGWHIDHVKPLASFDLSDKKQVLEACHYSNLQPLWAKDNLSKSDRY